MNRLNRVVVLYKYLPSGTSSVKSGKINFVKSGVKFYFNAQHLLYTLGKDARSFYDYLCERMNNQNSVTIDAEFKTAFITHFSNITGKSKPVAFGSISNYTAKLEQLALIINGSGTRSGFYLVNPKYAFKGSDNDRVKLIKKLIENRGSSGLSLRGLIDVPEIDL